MLGAGHGGLAEGEAAGQLAKPSISKPPATISGRSGEALVSSGKKSPAQQIGKRLKCLLSGREQRVQFAFGEALPFWFPAHRTKRMASRSEQFQVLAWEGLTRPHQVPRPLPTSGIEDAIRDSYIKDFTFAITSGPIPSPASTAREGVGCGLRFRAPKWHGGFSIRRCWGLVCSYGVSPIFSAELNRTRVKGQRLSSGLGFKSEIAGDAAMRPGRAKNVLARRGV